MTAGSHPCLAVSAKPESVDDLALRLRDLGSGGIEIRDRDTMTPGESGGVLLLAGFADATSRDAALAAMLDGGGAAAARAVDVTDDGWSTRWREFFRPVVLERLQVITPWMVPPRPDRLTVVIDPGQAFGTGGHPTTRLVLEMLEQRLAGAAAARPVLDVGTGSGVLAIAAAMLGAAPVRGIDIDAEALAAAEDNARKSGVSARVAFSIGGPENLGGVWPLVLANIELAAFRELALAIAARVAAGGELLVSGLLDGQAEACRSLFAGFAAGEERGLDGWVALSLVRR